MLFTQTEDPLSTLTPTWKSQIDPVSETLGFLARLRTPVLISLRDPSQFLPQKQYPLRPEARAGLHDQIKEDYAL